MKLRTIRRYTKTQKWNFEESQALMQVLENAWSVDHRNSTCCRTPCEAQESWGKEQWKFLPSRSQLPQPIRNSWKIASKPKLQETPSILLPSSAPLWCSFLKVLRIPGRHFNSSSFFASSCIFHFSRCWFWLPFPTVLLQEPLALAGASQPAPPRTRSQGSAGAPRSDETHDAFGPPRG